MKKALLVILVLAACAGCNKTADNTETIEPEAVQPKTFVFTFSHSGCARTKVYDSSLAERPSLITLKYVEGALKIIHTDTYLNCSINASGAACKAVVDGALLKVRVEALGGAMKCLCPVKEITVDITGLTYGEKYSLDYECSSHLNPVSFVFDKDLFMVLEESTLLPDDSKP